MDRETARVYGELRYIRKEKPCKKCGGVIFYTKTTACVGCANALTKLHNQKIAAEAKLFRERNKTNTPKWGKF